MYALKKGHLIVMESTGVVSQLAERCADATRKYTLHQPYDDSTCYDLFRLMAQANPEATTAIFRQYLGLADFWVRRHKSYPLTGIDSLDFAHTALENLYFRLCRDFDSFPTLNSILAYLRRCAATAVQMHLRDQGAANEQLLDENVSEPPPSDSLPTQEELWSRITVLFSDPADVWLARCVWMWGFKPEEITQLAGSVYTERVDVYNALKRIRRVLRADRTLRAWAGLATDENALDNGE